MENLTETDIIEQYIPLVRNITAAISKKLPPYVDRNELFSNGLFGLLSATRKFKPVPNASFKKYAGICIRGAIIDGVRHSHRMPHKEEDPDEAPEIRDPNQKSPREIVIQNELSLILESCLAQLSDKQRIVISLYYFKDMTFNQIGSLFGTSEGRVYNWLSEGINLLRKTNAINN